MTWLQTVVSSAVPAVVASGALIWQNAQNGRREDARRKDDAAERDKDRKADTQWADRSRLESLGDHWREERKEAHVGLLASLEEALSLLTAQLNPWSIGKGFGLDKALIDMLQQQVTVVQIIGTQDSRKSAQTAHNATLMGHYSMYVVEHAKDDEKVKAAKAKVEEWMKVATTSQATYLDSVRLELGTMDTA